MNSFQRPTIKWVAPILLFLKVALFWSYLNKEIITVVPKYTGEITALKTLNWENMWGNVLLSTSDYWYYRISPTALFPLSLIDRDFFSALFGITFPSESFRLASRVIPIGIIVISCMSLSVFFLAKSLDFNPFESFLAGLFTGVFKGIGWFFNFVSTVFVIPLFIIYSTLGILFFVRFLKTENNKYLFGYYIFLIFAIGSWEQWVDLLAFLLVFSILFQIVQKKISKIITLNGILIPILLFIGYLGIKFPYLQLEASNSGQEAEYVFNYPAKRMMIEDAISNASLHISDVLEPLFMPWPMLSQTVITGLDPKVINTWNNKEGFNRWSEAHYLAFTDWYAGLFFGMFIIVTIISGKYILNHPIEFLKLGVGLILVWTGFFAHLPIMFRAHFIVPGWEGMLGYKHMLSVVGVSLMIAWLFEKFYMYWLAKTDRLRSNKIVMNILLSVLPLFVFCLWILNNNYAKVISSFFLRSRGYFW